MPTPEAIAVTITACLAARLSNAPASPSEIEAVASIWLADLSSLTDEELSAAASRHRRESRWWPTPADLLAAHQAVAPATRWLLSDAEEDSASWDTILAHLQRHGVAPGLRTHLTDPQRRALEDVGGLWSLGQTPQSALGAIRARYLDRCKALRAPAQPTPAALGGPTLRLLGVDRG